MKNSNEDLHSPRIGIDLLGCDIPGVELLSFLVKTNFEEKHPPKITLFGTQEIFDSVPASANFASCVTCEVIEPDEDPISAVRTKRRASINLGISQIKSYDLDAFISAGNTGALLTSAKLNLPMLPGIDRPALLTLIPTKSDPVAVLDVGASVEAKAENLLQFAKMGIAYQKTRDTESPTVGLLNIGTEKQKGTPELRKAYKMLQSLNEDASLDSPIFIGNIEGRDVFHGEIDVLVTDGFTGNIFLKTAEGIAGFVLEQIENIGPIGKIPGLRSLLPKLRQRLHYAEFPGAILCGVEGIVMKCHGSSSPEAFINSIKSSSRLVKHFFIEKIRRELSH
ncbi:MAG: Phosphate acyltransferase [Chlamydiae bacterium]|nr:Phosphate acyltransferase [Chlamydiota bacterium]